jgi:hypothetical protein
MTLGTAAARSGALEAVERIINREAEADVILRQAVAVLAERLDVRWAGIAFVEEGGLALGPAAGAVPPSPARPDVVVPVDYRRALVAELWLDADSQPDPDERPFLLRLADLLSPYCLVGWDTGGEAWEV